ncbi:MAG: hypothetical protein ACK4RK_21940 [Gemmataceae bacterium]
MRPCRGLAWVGALLLVIAGAGSAQAAWHNVFQACCASCGGQASASYYAAAPSCAPSCCQPCCPQTCVTQYVQRCYYQPVTSYVTRTYYQPVTSYYTSYYYEPVTTYRYSCYYDPCTCSYQQVACPVTSYRLRSQCNPVTSFMQRSCLVPVTSYRQSCYYEPVTTCCAAPCCPPSCPAPCCNGTSTQPAAPAPTVTEQAAPSQSYSPPNVTESRTPPQAAPNDYNRFVPQPNGNHTGSSQRSFAPPAPAKPAPLPPPAVRLDKIVSLPAGQGQVQGQVVADNNAPRSGAQLIFVSTARQGQQAVRADTRGQFQVQLASGSWLVYVQDNQGQPVFHSRIEVQNDATRQVTLVSR